MALGFSPDGRTVAAVSHGGNETDHLRFFDVRTGLMQGSFDITSSYPMEILFSPDGRCVALTSWDEVKLMYLPRFIGGNARVDEAALPALWDDLNNPDVRAAYRAYWRLVQAGPIAVRFMRDRLPPVREVPAYDLRRFVKELGHANYSIRHRAMQALEGFGESAATALRDGLANNPSLETRRRIEALVAKHHDVRRDRAVEILATIGTVSARSLLEEITVGRSEANLTRNAKLAVDRLTKRAVLP